MNKIQNYLSHQHYAIGHNLAWLTMLFFAFLPFIAYWQFSFGWPEFYLRQGKGYLALNAIIVVVLCSCSAAIGGYWWRLINRLAPSNTKINQLCVSLLALLTLGYFLHYMGSPNYKGEKMVTWPYFSSAGLILLTPLAVGIYKNPSITKSLFSLSRCKSWFKKPSPINTFFFLFLIIALFSNNIIDLSSADLQPANSVSFALGRLCLQISLAAAFALYIEFLLRATPKNFHWSIWSMYCCVLVVVIVDTFTSNLGRPLYGYINDFTALGEFNYVQELKAGNFHTIANLHPSLHILICCLFFTLTYFTAIGLFKLSIFTKWKFSLKTLTLIALIGVSLNIFEQAIGTTWKDLDSRRAEQRITNIHLHLFSPQKGLGKYEIKFAVETPTEFSKEPLQHKPDIYFIMVESMRADTITPKITPFLHSFSKSDCQPFEHSWAGANATHLSWFSIFHGLPPMHWGHVMQAQDDKSTYLGSPSIAWLKAQDYNIEVRAVCDLSYKKFGVTNFGKRGEFANLIDDAGPDGVYNKGGISDREIAAFDDIKTSIIKNKNDKNFYFIGLDSPHYNYFWHESFTPPFDDYLVDIKLPVSPSEEEILQYRKRYWNACAWVDHQIKDFVTFLKQQGKFDNSIIVITGDHGEEFKEHGNWFHCTNLTPEQTAVPIFIKWPRGTNSPKKHSASHLDIMPSILKYLGASDSTLKSYQGKDLLSPGDDHTTIIATNYPGSTGYTMRLRKGDHSAMFSWNYYWTGELPETLVLENIEVNGESIPLTAATRKESSDKALKLLKQTFPDAFERFILQMDPSL